KRKEKEQQQTRVEYTTKEKAIQIEKAIVNYGEEYDKKVRNLQLAALVLVLIVTLISPMRLFDSRTVYDFTAVGFVIAGMIPSIIAIFNFTRGRRFCLFLSLLIYGTWIIILSTYYWEAILLASLLIIYYEIIRVIHVIEPMLKGVESIAEGGAYYHANVYLTRYFKFLLKFTGLLLGTALMFGVIGRYALQPIQGDIVFSIFVVVYLVLIIIISRRALTPDIQAILIKEQRDRLEEDLARNQSRFA
ncbi:MAG: hypothetical protein ACTSQB_06655, partial [Candidatus Heimdallarchaeota archaeon]